MEPSENVPVKSTPDENATAAGPVPKAKEEGSTEYFNIKVVDSHSSEIVFKLKPTTKLEKLMGAYHSRMQVPPETLRFLFDGRRLLPRMTPQELGMVDGDVINVYKEQVGGST